MAPLPIYTYGAPVLRKKAHPVSKVNDEIIRLVMGMFETMRGAGGIGLAATQVGSLHRIVVIDVSGMEETKGIPPLTLINPKVEEDEGLWTMEEGCLSIPDVRDDVERAGRIRFTFRDASFEEQEAEAGGMLARVVLHEIDHLNGKLFIDHLSPGRRKVHAEALRKIRLGEMEVDYPVVTAADVAA